MKKRGFTLIELLAVIIILAVIALITIPFIINTIDDAEKNSFKDSAYGMIEAAKIKSSQEESETAFRQKFYDLTDGTLDYKGDAPDEGVVSTDSKGRTSIEMHDDKWCVKKGFSDENVTIVPYDNSSKPCDGSGIEVVQEDTPTSGTITETIYWALQDNDNNGANETLVISDSEVTGILSGSFAGDREFTVNTLLSSRPVNVPWISGDWYSNQSIYVTNVRVEGKIAPASTAYWFYGVGYRATSFTADLTNLDTSNVTNMSYMFYETNSNYSTPGDPTTGAFKLIGIEDWNTSKVTNMDHMFCDMAYRASSWNIGDLGKWNTSNVTNMSSMFSGTGFKASVWNAGDLKKWNTSNVTDMSGMFWSAGYFTTTLQLDLSGWNTSKVTNMKSMFRNIGNSSTTLQLDLSGWNTSKVTNMQGMFDYAGYDVDGTWDIIIPKTNSASINNETSKMYGETSSTYAQPPAGRSFTLAN